MWIESTSLRIKSEIRVFLQEETWQEERVSEAFSAIQVQLRNKLAEVEDGYNQHELLHHPTIQ